MAMTLWGPLGMRPDSTTQTLTCTHTLVEQLGRSCCHAGWVGNLERTTVCVAQSASFSDENCGCLICRPETGLVCMITVLFQAQHHLRFSHESNQKRRISEKNLLLQEVDLKMLQAQETQENSFGNNPDAAVAYEAPISWERNGGRVKQSITSSSRFALP